MSRRGRPFGEKSLAMFAAIRSQPRPIRDLAFDLQLSIKDAHNIGRHLVVTGRAVYGEKVPGTHDKPARVLKPAPEPPVFPKVIRLF